jgi:putative DNA primase/helicase
MISIPNKADLKADEALMSATVMKDATTTPNTASAAPDAEESAGFTEYEAAPETAGQAVARLSKLPAMAYDQIRETEAKRLGIRCSTLDDEVRKARGETNEPTHGRRLSFKTHEPHPQPVRLDSLLDDLAAALDRHVILSAAARDATALWIAHTWVYNRFQHTPRLAITSPEKRCGKSTLLDVLRSTCLSPVKADNISASSVFRTIEALSPLSLLIDEADTHLKENAEELRGVLNSGFERSGMVIRVVEIAGEHTPVQFATFAPVALAAIKALPGTLEDRAIPIRLERKSAAQTVAKMRDRGARNKIATIGSKLARWARDDAAQLNENPEIPAALNDREGDISVPILSIADAAGPAWAARGRRALLTLFGDRANDQDSGGTGAMLLSDIKTAFQDAAHNRLASTDLANRLGSMEDRPWAEWRQGKPITAPQLSRALAPFRIRPHPLRLGGAIDRVVKGYQLDQFDDAFARYLDLAPSGGDSNGYTVTTQGNPQKIEFLNGYNENPVTDAKHEKTSNPAMCNRVTVSKGGYGHQGDEKDELGL